MAETNEKRSTHPLARIMSLLRTGPNPIRLRLTDQIFRKRTGTPVWELCQVTPQLYVGGQHYPKGWEEMQQHGITAVLNMRESHHDDAAQGIGSDRHLHIPTRDNTPPLIADLERGAQFIAEEIERGGKVYVHCGVGVGRAPSAGAAYLISTGMSADEALKTIKKVRPFVHLTPGQKRRLHEFEAYIRAKQQEAEKA